MYMLKYKSEWLLNCTVMWSLDLLVLGCMRYSFLVSALPAVDQLCLCGEAARSAGRKQDIVLLYRQPFAKVLHFTFVSEYELYGWGNVGQRERMFDAKHDIHSDRYTFFFLAGTNFRWWKYVLLLVTSPHRWRADGHWLGMSTSCNPTTKDLNYPFKATWCWLMKQAVH